MLISKSIRKWAGLSSFQYLELLEGISASLITDLQGGSWAVIDHSLLKTPSSFHIISRRSGILSDRDQAKWRDGLYILLDHALFIQRAVRKRESAERDQMAFQSVSLHSECYLAHPNLQDTILESRKQMFFEFRIFEIIQKFDQVIPKNSNTFCFRDSSRVTWRYHNGRDTSGSSGLQNHEMILINSFLMRL